MLLGTGSTESGRRAYGGVRPGFTSALEGYIDHLKFRDICIIISQLRESCNPRGGKCRQLYRNVEVARLRCGGSAGTSSDISICYYPIANSSWREGADMPSSYTLGDHFEAFIREQVDGGRYSSAS
jgi:hypothetical protein